MEKPTRCHRPALVTVGEGGTFFAIQVRWVVLGQVLEVCKHQVVLGQHFAQLIAAARLVFGGAEDDSLLGFVDSRRQKRAANGSRSKAATNSSLEIVQPTPDRAIHKRMHNVAPPEQACGVL
jgi:hypothetical protein